MAAYQIAAQGTFPYLMYIAIEVSIKLYQRLLPYLLLVDQGASRGDEISIWEALVIPYWETTLPMHRQPQTVVAYFIVISVASRPLRFQHQQMQPTVICESQPCHMLPPINGFVYSDYPSPLLRKKYASFILHA